MSNSNLSISDIKVILEQVKSFQDSRLAEFATDSRVGVQKELERTKSRLQKNEKLLEKYQEMSAFEDQAAKNGYRFVAGIDEVGRGPLAGPVVAAAVILPEKTQILGLDDSKKLSKNKREELYEVILKEARGVGFGIVKPAVIDIINIYEASKRAMILAIANLPIPPDFLLIDAMKLDNDFPQESLVKGDARSVSIAAASIVAKVTRDMIMEDCAQIYPEYGFERNAGYGTKEHLEAMKKHGITPFHRKSFAPVRPFAEAQRYSNPLMRL